jgi:ankyrin repeat protein
MCRPTSQRVKTAPAALLEWFLKKGANPNARPHDGSSIIFEVMKYGEERREKVKLLLDYGADPNAIAASNGYNVGALYSPLLFAAHQELWDVCQLLLESGADAAYRVPEEAELIQIMKQTSYYAGNTESHGEDLPKIMDKQAKSYV